MTLPLTGAGGQTSLKLGVSYDEGIGLIGALKKLVM